MAQEVELSGYKPDSYAVPIAEWDRLVKSEQVHREQLQKVAEALRNIGSDRVWPGIGHDKHSDTWPYQCERDVCPDYQVLEPYLKPTAHSTIVFPFGSNEFPHEAMENLMSAKGSR